MSKQHEVQQIDMIYHTPSKAVRKEIAKHPEWWSRFSWTKRKGTRMDRLADKTDDKRAPEKEKDWGASDIDTDTGKDFDMDTDVVVLVFSWVIGMAVIGYGGLVMWLIIVRGLLPLCWT